MPDKATPSALAGVRNALATLRTARSPDDLYERAARALCDHCGFDRAVIFRLQGYEMIPQGVYFAGDPVWAEEFREIGQKTPMRIDYDIIETEMISSREPMLIPAAQINPRGFKPLVEASRTRSYVAAPVVPENVIMGFVHGDCYFADRDVTAHDRDVIGAFAEGLGYAIQRTVLQRQVAGQRLRIARLRGVVDEMVERVSDAVGGLERSAGGEDKPTAPVLTVPGFDISRREAEILQRLGSGETEAGIAVALAIPKASVAWHIERAVAKLGAADQDEAVARYLSLSSRAHGSAVA